jgi:hypothetical protein
MILLLLLLVHFLQSISDIREWKRGVEVYLRKNTHRQFEWSLIAPPSTGPITLATAKTEDIIAIYLPYFSAGTTMVAMTPTME